MAGANRLSLYTLGCALSVLADRCPRVVAHAVTLQAHTGTPDGILELLVRPAVQLVRERLSNRPAQDNDRLRGGVLGQVRDWRAGVGHGQQGDVKANTEV